MLLSVYFLDELCLQSDDLSAKRVEWRKKEADLCMEVHYLKEACAFYFC